MVADSKLVHGDLVVAALVRCVLVEDLDEYVNEVALGLLVVEAIGCQHEAVYLLSLAEIIPDLDGRDILGIYFPDCLEI